MQCCDLEGFTNEDAGSRHLYHSCIIGNHEFGTTFCDFGASINLMPLFVVKRLSLVELAPTTMTLQMVDRTMDQLEGILEDVLIKEGKLIFLVDFVGIDMEEEKQVHYCWEGHSLPQE